MIHKSLLRRLATLVAICALVSTLSFTQTGCSNANLEANVSAAVAGAEDVITAMAKEAPGDPRIAAVRKFVDDGQAFLDALRAAPAACAGLASRAAALVSAFQVAILPLLSASPIVAAAIVGIDVALRVIAANFHNCIQKAGGAVAAAAKLPGKMGPSIAAGDAATVAAAEAVFTRYLASPKLKK